MLAIVARIQAERGQVEQAVELYSLASRHPVIGNSAWFEDLFGRPVARLAEALAAETVKAARKRGRPRDLFRVVEQVLACLRSSPDLLQALRF